MSITFRGTDKQQAIETIHAFTTWLKSLDIGPITNAALENWHDQKDGIIIPLFSANSGSEMLDVLANNNSDKNENLQFKFMMSELYSSFLPKYVAATMKTGQKVDADKAYTLITAVSALGLFQLGRGSTARLHVMTSRDHEFKSFFENNFPEVEQEIAFTRFNNDAFETPFESYNVMFNEAPTPDAVKDSLTEYANTVLGKGDELHHVSCSRDGGSVTLYATPALAQAFLNSADMGEHEVGIVAMTSAQKPGVLMQRKMK